MNEQLRQTLSEIVAGQEESAWRDPQRCKGLLKDLCPDPKYRGLIDVLVTALTERVVDDLQRDRGQYPDTMLVAKLAQRLEASTRINSNDVLWAVELWAEVLLGYKPPPSTQAPQTLVVSSNGDGQYRTIPDAMHDAFPGDTILIKPGRYTLSVVLDKAIKIIGSSLRREEVVVQCYDMPCIQMQTRFVLVDDKE